MTEFEMQQHIIGAVKKHIEHYMEQFFTTACFREVEYDELTDSPALQIYLMEQLAALPVQLQLPDNKVIEATETLRDKLSKEVVDDFVERRKRERVGKIKIT